MAQTEYPPLEPAPPVPLDQVEWRVDGAPSANNTARFVPYIDAAIVARLLDAWVGPARWRDEYYPGELAGRPVLWCHLTIEVEPDRWVTKRDVGKPSNFEAEKGTVSDAFKRAASLKWGAGRNVYDLPGDMWAPCRTWTQNGKTYAGPNKETVPALLKLLAERGYSTEGLKVGSDGEDQEAADTKAAEQATSESETRAELMLRFNFLPKPRQTQVLDRLRQANIIKRKSPGAIGTVDAEHFEKVRSVLILAADADKVQAEAEPDGDSFLDGISHYQAQLNEDEQETWGAWMDDHYPGRSVESLEPHEAEEAFNAISEIAAGQDTAP